MLKRFVFRAALLFAFLLPATPAMAWWEYGHGTVGRIALLSVNPHTRAEIDRLLRQGRLLDTPTCSVRTIELAAYWPDCIKTLGERFSYTSSWHYQNVEHLPPVRPAHPLRRRQLRLRPDRAQRPHPRRHAHPDPRAADGAGLPRPLHGRSAPAHACRRSWRPRRQPRAGPLWRDRRADQSAHDLGRLSRRPRHLAAARPGRRPARRGERRRPCRHGPRARSPTGRGRAGR